MTPEREKVYEVTVILRVYGQTSKAAAQEFLEEALQVDGLEVEKVPTPKLVKTE